MPLAVYWRTPEGQMLPDAARQRIAEGLGLLGTACGKLGDAAQGEEVMRRAVHYAQAGAAGARIFARLGRILMDSSRYGEAIASLRRASMLAPEESGEKHGVLLDLARCFQARGAKVAALASLMAARKAGSTLAEVAEVQRWLDAELGVPLDKWRALTASK